MGSKQDFNILKDVFILLRPDHISRNPISKRDHEERRKRVLAWLAELDEFHQACKENPWKKIQESGISIVPKFVHLLRECVLTHNWKQVLCILDCLVHVPAGSDWIVWKTSLAAFYTEPDTNKELIEQFFKQLYLMTEINVRDVVLEQVFYLLTQGMTQEASQAIQDLYKKRKGLKCERQREFSQHLCTLLDAYQGIIYYIEWRAAIYRTRSSQESSLNQSFYDLMQPTECLSEEAIHRIAERALLGLERLPDKRGVWDIFIPKAIEIHEYYSDFTAAKKLLDTYREKNPDNPNCHRFLYDFIQRNTEHFDSSTIVQERICCLKSLMKLDPANALVLKLCDEQAASGDGHAMNSIFELLDFSIWRERLQGWQWLANFFKTLLSRNQTEDEKRKAAENISSCWSTRKDWWPEYHFSEESIHKTSLELLSAKCLVAAVLLGIDCNFCQITRNNMDATTLLYYDAALSDMDLELFHLQNKQDQHLHRHSKTKFV